MALPPRAARALADLGRHGIHLGLGHVRRLLGALGDPHLARPTVLVAGTNGKGSTAATLAAMATAAGWSTGLYTSPHLEDVEERVRLDGRPVDGDRLGEALLSVLETAERLRQRGELDSPPTYFEALTAAAAQIFAESCVDLAVLEVGLGGRLDATNTAEPVLSVITPVDLDHRELLGDTLQAVAGEKAGILRLGRPAVAWGEDPAVRRTLRNAADERGADLSFVDDEVFLHAIDARPPEPWGGLRLRLGTPLRTYELETPLAGRHQAVNLALAVRAAERLGEVTGLAALSAEAIEAGAAAVRWPGRLESVLVEVGGTAGPAAGATGSSTAAPEVRILLDAAHNPAGAATLAEFLHSVPAADRAPRPILVFGVLADKDAAGMLPPLAGLASHVVLTRPPGDRGLDPAKLAPWLADGADGGGAESPSYEIHADPGAALAAALDRAARSGDGPVVVSGSLALVGAARTWLRSVYGKPEA